MQPLRNATTLLTMILLAAAFSACGGHTTFPEDEADDTIEYDRTQSESDDVDTSAVTGTTDEEEEEDIQLGSEPTYLETVRGTGYSGTDSIKVRTSTRLKVRFTPGVQDSKVSGTGYSPTYSKLGLYVTIGSKTRSTTMLSNGVSGSAQNSALMDFSDVIAEFPCVSFMDSGDENCERRVTITVEHPSYDFLCFNYGTYCPHSTVNEVHPWNGTLEIETDDTYEISDDEN